MIEGEISQAAKGVASYLPMRTAHALGAATGPMPGQTQALRGPVMFVDLVGFTPFVLSLCRLKKRGIEALQGVLSDYFSTMVECIYQHGGDVFYFAGDAVLVGFTGDQPEDDAARAVNCARDLHARLAKYQELTILGQRHSVVIKVGIGFGDYHYTVLGRADLGYAPLILGAPVQSAVDAESHAEGGGVVLDSAMWRCLGSPPELGTPVAGFVPLKEGFNSAGGADSPHAATALTAPEVTSEQCAGWIEPALYRKVLNSHVGYMADFRDVTCLFARFSGCLVEGDIAATIDRLNSVYTFARARGNRYGAILNHIEIGDKGYVLFFALGALQGVEEKCTLAGRLALGLCQHSLSFVDRVQVGIATGEGYSGDIGAPSRKSYTITGDVVNRAARLMTYGRDTGIYVDDPTHARMDSDMVTRAIPEVRLKGIDKPVTIHRLHSEIQHRQTVLFRYTDTMVGRHEELNRLRTHLKRVENGQGSICSVLGEPGAGKSRLIGAFLKDAATQATEPLVGVCHSYEKFTPYYAWRPVFRALLKIDDHDDEARLAQNIADALDAVADVSVEWTPVLAQLAGITLAETSLTRDLHADQKRRRVFEIVARLLERRASTQVLVLCFEDLHWADQASLELIRYLAARTSTIPMLLLMVSRNEDTLSDVQELPDSSTITVKPLSDDEARRLLHFRIERCRLSETVERDILNKADGNPLFIESIAQGLLERDLADADSTAAPLRDMQIPDSLQDLTLARFDQLDEDAKTVLRIASVSGRDFEDRLIRRLLPASLDEARLPALIERLHDLGFILVLTQSPLTYSFKHAVIRDVIYDTLPLSARVSLHRRVGDDIETVAGERAAEEADRLAHHFLAGEDASRGFAYSVLAARRARDQYANEDAIYHYGNALELISTDKQASDTDERRALTMELANVYRRAGRYRNAAELFNVCFEYAREPAQRAEIHIGLGSVYQERGNVIRAIEELETALELLGRRAPGSGIGTVAAIASEFLKRKFMSEASSGNLAELDPVEFERCLLQSRVLELLSKIYFFVDARKTAWTVFAQRNVAERLGSAQERCQAYAGYAIAMMGMGLTERAARYSRRALTLAQKAGNPMVLASVHLRKGVLGLYTEDPALTRQEAQKAADIYGQFGEMWERLTALSAIATAWMRAADFRKTEQVYGEVEQIATELNSSMHIGWAKCWRPWCHYLLSDDRVDSLKQEIRSAIPYCTESNDRATQILALGHLCAIAVREGDAANAAWLADEVYTAWCKYRTKLVARTPQIALVYAAEAALFALEQGATDVTTARLREIATQAAARAVKLGKGFPYLYGPGLRVQAGVRAHLKGPKRARSLFERALKILTASPDLWQTGLAYYDMARLYPDAAADAVAQAAKLFAACDAAAEQRRLADLSRALHGEKSTNQYKNVLGEGRA